MPHEFTIDPHTGTIYITGFSLVLRAGVARPDVFAALSALPWSRADHRNGYEWLIFEGLSFGGGPAVLSMCFHQGLLREIRWDVDLRPASADPSSWPSREECDQEIVFVRGILCDLLSRPFTSGQERFPWGEVWSLFDERGGFACAGLRYDPLT